MVTAKYSLTAILGTTLYIVPILLPENLIKVGHAQAACITAGSTATCSGAFVPVDFPQSFTVAGDGVNTLVLDETVNATVVDTVGFELQNTNAATAADLSLTMAAGATITWIDGPGGARDAVYLRNRGSGSNTVTVAGDITAEQRGVRFWSDNSLAGELDHFTLAEGATINAGATGFWLRHSSASLGGILVDIAGDITSAGPLAFRGVHVSANGVFNASDIIVNIAETGSVTSTFQGIYIGNHGTGQVQLNIDGTVQGGAESGFTPVHPSAGVIIDAEGGGSRIVISETGTVGSLNDLAIIDSDVTSNTTTAAAMTLINAGTITGYVDLGGGDDVMTNTGTWQVRNWDDTNNDGVRDTKGGAISDFGAGTDSLTNYGTISLLAVPGDNTPSQAFFDGLESFQNHGLLTAKNGFAGDSITINGNYGGTGQLQLDVDFATDTADTLTVNGNVTGGTTRVDVNDVSRGLTTRNDILLVDVTGTTVGSDFSLARPVVVVEGAYGYDYDLNLVGQSWFLQTDGRQLLDQTDGYRLLSSLYEHSIDTLHHRVGHRDARFNGTGDAAWEGIDGWVRVVGKKDRITPDSEVGYQDDRYYLQAGVDIQVQENSKGRLLAGVNIHAGQSDATIDDEVGVQVASLDSDFYGFGLTATWYGDKGLYADLVGQATWYNSDFSAERTDTSIDGSNLAVSIEVGKRYSWTESISLVPQGQVIRSKGDFDNFTDDDGVRVKAENSDNTTLRLGLMLEHKGRHNDKNNKTGYLIANIYQRFSGDHEVAASGTRLKYSPHDRWVQVGAGGSIALNKYIDLTGQLGVKASLDDFRDSHSLGGTIGIRATW